MKLTHIVRFLGRAGDRFPGARGHRSFVFLRRDGEYGSIEFFRSLRESYK